MCSSFMPDGIVGTIADTTAVYADSTGMQVKIRSGKIATVHGHGWYSGSSDFTKTVTANASGSARVDLVVLRLSRSTWAITAEVKAGTPGSGVPPSLTQDAATTGAGVWEIPLATVAVANGAVTIAAGNVTNAQQYVAPNPAMGFARRTSDLSRASTTTLTADTQLAVPVMASAMYEVMGHIKYTAGGLASANGFKQGWTFPTGATIDWSAASKTDADGTNAAASGWFAGLDATLPTISSGGAGAVNLAARPYGILITSTTPGTLAFAWAQHTSSVTATVVKTNSFIIARRIG